MRNKETGEFEVLVGNGQLLSGFFILLLLLAVTFCMGYVVGQNSPRSAKLAGETASSTLSDVRQQPQAPVQTAPSVAQAPATADPAAGAAPPAEAPPQPTTQPAREAEVAPASPPPAVSTASSVPDGPPGSFWQVGVWKETKVAEVLVASLKEGGFPAFVRVDASGLAHAMVGPYSDPQTMGRAKIELQTRFKLNQIMRK